MSIVYKVGLPGVNVLTDQDPTHFSVFETNDGISEVLIKENVSGRVNLADGDHKIIAHNFGYVPLFLVFAKVLSLPGYIQPTAGQLTVPAYAGYADSQNLYIDNNSGSSTDFSFFIFYDQQEIG